MRLNRLHVVVCLSAGLLINLGAAVQCLLHHSPPAPVWPHFSAQWYWNRYVESPVATAPATFHHVSAAVGCDFFIIDASPANPGIAAPPRMMISRAGFPLRCLEGMHSWGGVKPATAWAVPIQPRLENVAWVSIIPCRPLILGMLVNTLFFGAIVWLVIFGPAYFYRSHKADQWRRLNCCQRCGYDLQGDLARGCPECGWRRANP